MVYAGIDIGGMSIKAGIVSEDGKILIKKAFVPLKTADESVVKMAETVKELLKALNLEETELKGIGVGCPGTVNSEKGIVDCLTNLKWFDYPLAYRLKKNFDHDIKVKLSNDANVAVLAEHRFGEAKGAEICVMLTLGTGVGGGVIIDGKLFEGGESKGTELGHVSLVAGGVKCGCGRRGCIEAYVSTTALIRQTKYAMRKNKDSMLWKKCGHDLAGVNGKDIFECAREGDETALIVLQKYRIYLAESIMNMCNIFRPEVFIIGGGISAQGDFLLDGVRTYCEKFDYGFKDAPHPRLVTASLGNDAGIIGSACLVI